MGALEAVRKEVASLDPKIIELENKISVEQDAAARTKLETELATLVGEAEMLLEPVAKDLVVVRPIGFDPLQWVRAPGLCAPYRMSPAPACVMC